MSRTSSAAPKPDIAAVYVNVGTELGKLASLSGLFSPGLMGSFAILDFSMGPLSSPIAHIGVELMLKGLELALRVRG